MNAADRIRLFHRFAQTEKRMSAVFVDWKARLTTLCIIRASALARFVMFTRSGAWMS